LEAQRLAIAPTLWALKHAGAQYNSTVAQMLNDLHTNLTDGVKNYNYQLSAPRTHLPYTCAQVCRADRRRVDRAKGLDISVGPAACLNYCDNDW
jgi:hypothetical protein